MSLVLLSHTKSEAPLVKRVATLLNSHGYESSSQHDTSAGESWADELERVIERAFGAIFFFSSQRISSKFMLLEFDHIVYNSRFLGRVLPVVVMKDKSDRDNEAPWIFQSLSTVQILNVDLRRGFDRAAGEIATAFVTLIGDKGEVDASRRGFFVPLFVR